MSTSANPPNLDRVRVWDPLVRLFHWSLVAAFTIAYLTGDEESAVHEYAGYVVIGLVLFRLVWGFLGTRHARFRDFVYRPSKIVQYAREILAGKPKRYLGHNPLGGVMVLLLLGSLLTTGVTGYLLLGTEVNGDGTVAATPVPGKSASGFITPAYADNDGDDDGEEGAGHDENEGPLKEVHEFFANFTLFLVFLHVAGVILASLQHRENLVRAMFTGRKPV
jgi:cytochrome b